MRFSPIDVDFDGEYDDTDGNKFETSYSITHTVTSSMVGRHCDKIHCDKIECLLLGYVSYECKYGCTEGLQ